MPQMLLDGQGSVHDRRGVCQTYLNSDPLLAFLNTVHWNMATEAGRKA